MDELILAVEIGGTKQQLAVGKADGTLLEVTQEKVVLTRGAEDILSWIQAKIPELLARKENYRQDVKKIGVGFGGPLESRTGRVLSSLQVPGWEDFPLKTWFESSFHLPSVVINDTVAGGFAELHCGAGRQAQNFFYTNIGTGIGGGMFIRRKYYDGVGFGASYLGNTFVPDWTDKRPGTAKKLENICSGMNIEKRLRTPGYVPHDSRMIELAGGQAERISCLILEQAVREGDAFAAAELDAITRSFGVALANFMAIMAPDCIAIGGGVAKMGDILFDRIEKYTAQYAFVANRNRYRIVQSELLDNAVLVGALICAGSDEAL